ncbi:hypothetical protein [Xanthomonas floridensis]|uniref:Uncharacterized protein n=1 Tax=Xanthomonas floridensis TaxID=1843580 RepID=A0A1A9MIM1_9XANT|nr:hypothetical protein [Xanthomonas floridensis]MEA5124528.1 hypothetical protein [Xanthomonas floridensis]OAG69450.1 hypothetical protein A7D17_01150 [Xanthomonas floridensis]
MRNDSVFDADVLDKGVPDGDVSSHSTLDKGVCGVRLLLTIMKSHPDMAESGALRQDTNATG